MPEKQTPPPPDKAPAKTKTVKPPPKRNTKDGPGHTDDINH